MPKNNAGGTVTTTTAAGAAADQASSSVTSFSVSDTAANIASYFNSLNSDTKLTSITASDGRPIPLTYTQFTTDTRALSLLASGTTVSVSAVPVADVAAVQASTQVTSFSVTDSGANIVAGLATLATETKLNAIGINPGDTVTVTYAQYVSYSAVLALLNSGDTATVTGASVANAAALQGASKVGSFSVSDTAANVLASLSSLASDSKLSSITLTGGTTLAVTYSQYSAYSSTLAKLVSGDTITVSGATASEASALQSSAHVSRFTVSDTAANIASNLSALASDTKLTAITLTSGSSLSITYAQYSADTAVLALLPSTVTYVLSGVPATSAATVQSASNVTSFSVTDTSANIAANLAVLASDTKLTAMTLSGGTTLAVTYTQYTTYSTLLGLLSSADKLSVSAVTAVGATAVQSARNVSSFTIADGPAKIMANIAAIATDTKLTSISLTNGTVIQATWSQYSTYTSTFNLLASGYTVSLTSVTVANVTTAQAAANISSMLVVDTAANIAAGLAALAAAGKVVDINLSSGTTVAVTWSQYSTYAATLNLIAGATLVVSGVPVASAGTLQTASNVSAFTVADTGANLAAGLAALAADRKLTGFSVSGGTVLPLSYAQYSTDLSTLALLSSSDTETVSGATVAQAPTLQAAAAVSGFTVTDSSTNVLAGISSLASDTKLTSIQLTDTPTFSITAAQYFADTATFDLVASGESLVVSGATVAQASTLQADSHVSAFSITDTSANLVAGAPQLAEDTKLTSETVSGGSGVTAVTYAQYLANKATLDASAGTGGLVVTGVTAAQAATVATDTAVKSLTVGDTLANIGTSLGSLQTLVTSGQLTGIAVTDSGQNLAVTAAESSADAGALAMMTGTFTVTRPVINLIWDSSVTSAPAGWVGAIEDAANYFDALITSPITVNIEIGYGETDGTTIPYNDVGYSMALNGIPMLATTFESDLATSTNNPAILADIPTIAATAPTYSMEVVAGEAKALGAMSGYGTEIDGASGFATDPTGTNYAYNPYDRAVPGTVDMIGLAEAELGHILGRISYVGVTTPLDLYRYSSDGVTTGSGNASYFSIDGGNTNLGTFDTTIDPSDWAASVVGDANDAVPQPDTVNVFSQTDVLELSALGYSITTNQPSATGVIPASAASGLNAGALTFIGSPQTITMGGSVTAASTAIPPSTGIEEIANFAYGTDTLTVNLSDLSGTLEAFDATINGVHAIALAGSNDLTNGIILTGMPAADTAANLLTNHLTIVGATATIH